MVSYDLRVTSVGNVPEHSIPIVIPEISLPQTQSISDFGHTTTTDDFIQFVLMCRRRHISVHYWRTFQCGGWRLKLVEAYCSLPLFINRRPTSSCLLKYIHPRTRTSCTVLDSKILKIARARWGKFFLSFQCFAPHRTRPPWADPSLGSQHWCGCRTSFEPTRHPVILIWAWSRII